MSVELNTHNTVDHAEKHLFNVYVDDNSKPVYVSKIHLTDKYLELEAPTLYDLASIRAIKIEVFSSRKVLSFTVTAYLLKHKLIDMELDSFFPTSGFNAVKLKHRYTYHALNIKFNVTKEESL